MAESLELPAGKLALAVRLIDVVGNDASATMKVKPQIIHIPMLHAKLLSASAPRH